MIFFGLVYSVLASNVLVFAFGTDKVISKGKWFVDRITTCPDPEQYAYNLVVQKRKLNRTHDGFATELTIDQEFDEDIGFMLETCMKMDGGCKKMHDYYDESSCRLLKEYGPKNLEQFLTQIGVHPDCPVPVGSYKIDEFVFDNSELPDDGLVGQYEATVWFTSKEKEKLACMLLYLEFVSVNDLPEYDDDEELDIPI